MEMTISAYAHKNSRGTLRVHLMLSGLRRFVHLMRRASAVLMWPQRINQSINLLLHGSSKARITKEFVNLLVFADMRGSLMADRRRSVTDGSLAVGNR